MKTLSQFMMMVPLLSLLVGTSGCFHHHKHVRNKPSMSEPARTPKVRYTPQTFEPARKVSTPTKIYNYQYYPTVNIYYDTTRKLYFFTDGEDWQESSSLPSHLHINLNEGVTIQLKSDKPFLADVSRNYLDPITW